jgi:hypothetical protein
MSNMIRHFTDVQAFLKMSAMYGDSLAYGDEYLCLRRSLKKCGYVVTSEAYRHDRYE